jgi:CubicO group peptidase (beta-lactamase class C family)
MKCINKIVVLASVIFSCNTLAFAPAENLLIKKIDHFLGQTVERLKIPGMTVAVTRNDSVIYTKAFGYTNIDSKTPMKPENIFHWASVSKTFVATAIMQLWEKEKIDLDEKLVTYLPYFKQKDDAYKNITIRQMLNHTSGIGDVEDYEWHKPQYDSGALERFVRSTANDDMLFTPGEGWQYSNTAYEALGDVISKVSGMPFETYVRKNIFDPLEMNVSSFLYPEVPESLKVSGHQWAGQPVVSKHYPYNRMHGPSSTLNSNVTEMTHYAFAHLHRGQFKGKRILQDETYNLLWTNSVKVKGKPKIGFAWWLDEHRGVKTVSHSGGDTGFRSIFLLVPEKNISIMLVCNYEIISTHEVAIGILDLLLDKQPEPVKQHVGFTVAEVMKTEGIAAAKRYFNKIRVDPLQRKHYRWKEDEAAFAYPAYLYLENNMYTEAIEMFKINLEQFPRSGWAHFHLATGYAKANQKDLARIHFRKAIELLPNETSFKKSLEEIGD